MVDRYFCIKCGESGTPEVIVGHKCKGPAPTAANLTLRDYFAGQAMTMIPYPQHLGLQEYETKHFADYTQRMAAAAYQIADAMLQAREEKP